MNRARGFAIATFVAAACLLGGCVSSPAWTAPPPPSVSEVAFPGAPAAVRERTPLRYCGSEVGHPPEGFNVEARQCFWTAYTLGEPAEFISTRPTANGLPITVIWRSIGGGRVEFFVDQTSFPAANAGWRRTTCPRLTLTNDPHVAPDWVPGVFGGGCTEQVLPAGP